MTLSVGVKTASTLSAIRTLAAAITNTGNFDAWEKAQCYAKFTDSRTTTPRCQLCAIAPVYLKRGETKTVELTVDRFWLKAVTPAGKRVDPDGGVKLYVGGGQPDENVAWLPLA